MNIGREYSKQFIEQLTNDERRKNIQFLCLFSLLTVVSGYMTIMNIITHKGNLTWATLIFTILCISNTMMIRSGKKLLCQIAGKIFMVEIITLFTYFIISGNPEGFSAIWICMLPFCGMLIYGRRTTTMLCAIMLTILLFFFQTPYGIQMLRYNYTSSFKMRFPVLFIAFFLLAYFLETIRMVTQKELDTLRNTYKNLYSHDNLTGLLNRSGLIELETNVKPGKEQTVLMMDIDYFKKVNDTYGHGVGDVVLKYVANSMREEFDTYTFRWGGEEFVVWYPEGIPSDDMAEKFRKVIEDSVIETDDGKKIKITISIGAITTSSDEGLEKLIDRTDEYLYRAKQTGRNKVVWGK